MLLIRFSRVQPTLCDPIDGSPPGSPTPGILQARTLEWVAISFSKAWKWKVKMKSLSRPRLLATPWTTAYQAPPSMGFSRQEYWSGVPLPSPSGGASGNLNEMLVAQSCPTLCDPTNCSPSGSSIHGVLQARIVEWIAISFFRGSSQPRDQTHVSPTGRWILYHWATRDYQQYNPQPGENCRCVTGMMDFLDKDVQTAS